MSYEKLSSKDVIGRLMMALEQNPAMELLNAISMLVDSDRGTEEYSWLGSVPMLRQLLGGRTAQELDEYSFKVENLHFEAGIEVQIKDMRRDKLGQIMLRINELATRAGTHWISLISQLLLLAESQPCYDGQFFFDTDHVKGKGAAQSNIISVDVSALPLDKPGTPTHPSVLAFEQAVLETIVGMQGFTDEHGEPLNELANNFVVFAPTKLAKVGYKAFKTAKASSSESSDLSDFDFNVTVMANPRLNSWSDRFAVLRADSAVKPFIRQQETAPAPVALAEGSDMAVLEKKHYYGIDTWRNAAYGLWEHAALCKMI
ncbi:MAG: Mu-like prophage major head subunit gpT family protein [Gammaproteobacteria bacterium]|nr:Mu-like prophage major head subunit gpT family protein [Gammaproteobacteria bacterium]